MPMSSLRERLLLIDSSSRALAVSFLIRTEKILYPSLPRSLDWRDKLIDAFLGLLIKYAGVFGSGNEVTVTGVACTAANVSKELAEKYNANVASVCYCHQAEEQKKGTRKCERPGNYSGQVSNNLQ